MSIAPKNKKSLYVGGLDERVTEKVLHAAFIPFGDLVDVQMPRENDSTHVGQDKPKGFAFVEFEEEEDAMAAMDNMNNSELYGRVLTVNVAKAQAMNRYRAIWEEKADEWIEGNKGVVEQDAASDSE